MYKREMFALTIVVLAVLGLPAALFGYQAWRTHRDGVRVIELAAIAPDAGGWVPDTLRLTVGERVRLRISASDVVHGLEIPGLGAHVDEILPGHVAEIELLPTQAGRFPFACTRWCSVDHWRMRGVIEVVDPAQAEAPVVPFAPPLYQQLGLDIDAQHPAQTPPLRRPSAARGGVDMPNLTLDFRTQSPDRLWQTLRADSANASWDDRQLWDALAQAYARTVGAESIARGAQLYARDCAACHAEQGDGTGPAGRALPGLAAMHPDTGEHPGAAVRRGPADFTDAVEMMGASDALLQGKILRGGMGTGMPEWGSLYREQDPWDVVAFLRTFTMDLETK